ncbi:Ada metal-binding domain-containing protein [Taibaiella soli]|uniref:Metal-binding protein n=1 Tax=Taibaiella soli TaxID=1649169 RepID=A0A2W2AGC4_9BACT|nr:Ada metal-binding domain-containing protein [Taibaiella soli]PZF71300.1 metal-binding protein [Taibaiella soli]
MWRHEELNDLMLRRMLRSKAIVLAGNRKLKIYGTLRCNSGKRMKKTNRIFFLSETEALENGYRPCGHCMSAAYKKWKSTHESLRK